MELITRSKLNKSKKAGRLGGSAAAEHSITLSRQTFLNCIWGGSRQRAVVVFFTWIKQPIYASAVSRLKQAEKYVYIQIIVRIKALLY